MPINEDIVTPVSGIDSFSYEDVNTLLNTQRLWIEANQLTRSFFKNVLDGHTGQSAEGNRLFIKLPADINNEFKKYFSEEDSRQFLKMISRLISGYWQIMTSYKNLDPTAINFSIEQWYQNADELAAFLARINKNYDEIQLKNFLHEYLGLWINEIIAVLNRDYELENTIYDKIQDKAVRIASFIAMGVILMRRSLKSKRC